MTTHITTTKEDYGETVRLSIYRSLAGIKGQVTDRLDDAHKWHYAAYRARLRDMGTMGVDKINLERAYRETLVARHMLPYLVIGLNKYASKAPNADQMLGHGYDELPILEDLCDQYRMFILIDIRAFAEAQWGPQWLSKF